MLDNKVLIELARQIVAEADAIAANNAEILRRQNDNVEREANIALLRERMVTVIK